MIDATFLVLDESMDMLAVVLALRAWGLRPMRVPAAEDATEAVLCGRPKGVILQAGRPGWLALLRFLGHRRIPCVLLGTSGQLRSAEKENLRCLRLLLPVEPEKLAEGAQLVIGSSASAGLPDIIDLGAVKIDLRTCTAEIDGKRKMLPPKEFQILVHLALQPGAPLDSIELLGRLWRGSESATVDDLRTRVWRLRRMIDDHKRPQPLIVNRRGKGYMLNIAGPASA
jgi:DNA-binding response OmpR family regulator